MKATVTTQTSKVNVNSYSDDVLIHPKRTSVGISVPNATGGGSYVEKDFRALTIANIAVVAIGLSTGQYVSATGTIQRSNANSVSLVASLERSYANP